MAVAADIQVVRVDIPALDVKGACVSIIGGDEHQGVLLFPSAADFDRYLEDVATGALDDGSPGLGTEVLSLTFSPAAGLPPTMRREAMEHGWPVAGPDAYPRLQHLDPDGRRRALVERDVAERRWLDAQRAAWLSVWEVEAVEPGRSLTLHDLLSDERRTVQEMQGSRTLVVRDALLGRVVEQDGGAVLCGTHPCPLPPFDAADVVRRARGHLRHRRAVPVERLRKASFGRYLIRRWEEAVEYRQAVNALPPDLCNHDGDPLLLTVDQFEIRPGSRETVDEAVSRIDGAEREPSDPDTSSYVLLRADDPERPDGQYTIIGRAEVGDTTLRLESNSAARADALRERMETACGAGIRHRGREHTDPLALRHQTERRPPALVSPDGERLVAEFKARHYAGWPDQPLPALNKRTPRECVGTAAGRRQVDLLLKDIEHTEQRGPGVPFDVSAIRRDLGLISR